MAVTMLYGETAVDADAREDGDRLWLTVPDLSAVSGWELKPEGLCRGEACIALPADGSWQDADGCVDLTADVRAAAHARAGKLLLDRGDNAGTPELVGELNVTPEFWKALNDLGEGYYCPPVDLPGIKDRTAV